jgi:hypothetical protein
MELHNNNLLICLFVTDVLSAYALHHLTLSDLLMMIAL